MTGVVRTSTLANWSHEFLKPFKSQARFDPKIRNKHVAKTTSKKPVDQTLFTKDLSSLEINEILRRAKSKYGNWKIGPPKISKRQ